MKQIVTILITISLFSSAFGQSGAETEREYYERRAERILELENKELDIYDISRSLVEDALQGILGDRGTVETTSATDFMSLRNYAVGAGLGIGMMIAAFPFQFKKPIVSKILLWGGLGTVFGMNVPKTLAFFDNRGTVYYFLDSREKGIYEEGECIVRYNVVMADLEDLESLRWHIVIESCTHEDIFPQNADGVVYEGMAVPTG